MDHHNIDCRFKLMSGGEKIHTVIEGKRNEDLIDLRTSQSGNGRNININKNVFAYHTLVIFINLAKPRVDD